jgi:addiction module RelE/StbE family toxin
MNISFSRQFVKQLQKADRLVRACVVERIELFSEHPTHTLLRNHALKGTYKEYRSIDITDDYRALYLVRTDEVVFDMLGTHSQLYS